MVALGQLLGESPALVEVRGRIARVLRAQASAPRRLPPILILGETGTGKGLLASAIHRASARRSGPFVDVNCAAIPEGLLEAELFGFERGAFTDARHAKPGLFQAASTGTIFLDEVGLLPVGLQAKLLKVIEERMVRRLGSTRSEPLDVCVATATSEDLTAAVRAGRFRADLYHRLAVVTLTLPPLRERGADAELLAEHFLARACEEYGIPRKALSPAARAALGQYPWPGNVRELANVMERAALLADAASLGAEDLGLPARPAASSEAVGREPGPTVGADGEADEEQRRLRDLLERTGWNISHAAAELGVPRNTLRYRLEKVGLSADPSAGTRRRGGRPPSRSRIAPRLRAPAPSIPPREDRRVTMLLVRLVVSDSLGSAATRALEMVAEKAQSFGGHVTPEGPHAVVAAFGLEPGDDAPRRAAHAAIAIQALANRARRTDPTRPDSRLAIHTARVPILPPSAPAGPTPAVARIEPDARRAVTADLDALLQAGAPGTIVVSAAAVPFLARRFELAPIESASGGAWRLLGHTEPGRTRLVGRERELALLVERFEQARAGHGQLVLIAGEPGIGKSRLLRELQRRLGPAATWLEGQAPSFGRSMPFHPIVDIFRTLFRLDDGDADPVVVEKIERAVRPLGEDLDSLAPVLRHLLGVDPGDDAILRMDPKLRHAEILRATCTLIERGAEARPHVLVLEDAHWMDAASEEWVSFLVDGIVAKRVLVILTYRPGYRPPLVDRSHHTRLALGTLSTAENLDIARSVLDADDLPPELQALIASKAEGNPFYVEELARSLRDAGALAREGRRLWLTRPLGEIVVPDTIEDVILGRIERLAPAPRQALEIASVIGREFSHRLLDRLIEAPAGLEAAIRELKGVELIHERRLVPEVVYAFGHSLAQDVAYGTLPEDRRRDAHRRVGIAIEELYGDRLAEQSSVLAHHFTRAGEWPRALRHLLEAAGRAARAFATREALTLYDEALEAARHLPAETAADAAMAIHQAKAALCFVISDFDRSRAEAERLLALARERGDRAREASALAAIAWAATWARDLEGAVQYAQRAIVVAGPAGATAALARGHFTIGWVRAVTGALDEAARDLAHALTSSRSAGDLTHESLTLTAAGMVKSWQGAFAEADVLQAQGLALARRHGLLVPLLFAFFLRGLTLAGKGDYGAALAGYREGLALAEKVGDEAIHHRLLNCVGWIHFEMGDLDGAAELNQRSAEVGRRRNDPGTRPNAEINLGDVHLARGDLALAADIYEGVERFAADPSTSEWMRFRYSIRLAASQGQLWLARGDLHRARRHAERCLELATRTRARKNLVKGWRLTGEIAAARGAWDDAEEALREALSVAETIGNPTQLWQTQAALGRLLARRGQPDAARRCYVDARAALDRIAVSVEDLSLRASFAASPAVREIHALAAHGGS